jgi:hypothetical protein
VQAQGSITTSPIGRARRELDAVTLGWLAPLAQPAPGPMAPAVLHSSDPDPSGSAELISSLNTLTAAFGLDTVAPDQARAVAWLWNSGLAGTDLRGKQILSPGPFWHPLSWVLSFLGARVTITSPEPPRSLLALAENLRVDLRWAPAVPRDFACEAILAFTPVDRAALATLAPGAPVCIAGIEPARSWLHALGVPSERVPEAAIVLNTRRR